MTKRVAIVSNGIVDDVIIAEIEVAQKLDLQMDEAVLVEGMDPMPGRGWSYANGVFSPPSGPKWSDPNLDPRYWQIDTGPFKNRFDTYGYPGLKAFILGAARTNDICYAALENLNGRKYVDLKLDRPELQATFQAIATVVAAAGKPAFTSAMQAAITDTPTIDYERWQKDMVQPS